MLGAVDSLDSLLRFPSNSLTETYPFELDASEEADDTVEDAGTKQTCVLCGFDLGTSFSEGFHICEECATIVRSGSAMTEPIIKLVQKLHDTETKYNDLVNKVRHGAETVKLKLNDIVPDIDAITEGIE